MKTNSQLIISSLLIIVAFFLGYLFSERKQKSILDANKMNQEYVDISIKKNKLKIEKTNEAIQILINGQALGEELTLENVCE